MKARRLQNWEKLKKYVPIHKQGDVCPNGVFEFRIISGPPVHCFVTCIVQFLALRKKM